MSQRLPDTCLRTLHTAFETSTCELNNPFYPSFSSLGGIAHNVPAVYDVLTARIKKCAAFLGLAKCG
jgi:hypothetical protein